MRVYKIWENYFNYFKKSNLHTFPSGIKDKQPICSSHYVMFGKNIVTLKY